MRIKIKHTTHYTYDPPASRIALRLRLFPAPFDGQQTLQWDVAVNEEAVVPLFNDGFGDPTALWLAHETCAELIVTAEGVVETADRAGLVKGLLRHPPSRIFLRPTPLTEPDEAITKIAEKAQGETTLERMHALSREVEGAMTFFSGSTVSATTAREALAAGAGVCQDFAHIMIAAARHLDVPARYVVGYLLAYEDQAEVLETHAWAEVYIRDLGWVAFDPSNGVCATDHYVRLACGLDALAAAPVKGNVVGDTTVRLDAAVEIGQTQQQQNQQQNQQQR